MDTQLIPLVSGNVARAHGHKTKVKLFIKGLFALTFGMLVKHYIFYKRHATAVMEFAAAGSDITAAATNPHHHWTAWAAVSVVCVMAGTKFVDMLLDMFCPYVRKQMRRCSCEKYVPTNWQHPNLQKNIVFIGNPGSGKSTLLNGIAGFAYFRSGLSPGTGLTSKLDTHTTHGIRLSDTPGLADKQKVEAAAEAIAKALSQGGQFKIFFVIQINSARMPDNELATILSVVASCAKGEHGKWAHQTELSEFGVIVNKVSPAEIKIFTSTGDSLEKYVERELHHPMHGEIMQRCVIKVHVNKLDSNLKDAEDAARPLTVELENFINDTEAIEVDKDNVKLVDAIALENQVKQLEESNSKSVAKIDALTKQLDAQTKKLESLLRELRLSQTDPQVNAIKKQLEETKLQLDAERKKSAAHCPMLHSQAKRPGLFGWGLGPL